MKRAWEPRPHVTEHWRKRGREATYSHELHKYFTFSTAMFVLIEYFCSSLYNCSWITSCHVETNHWTLRCFWQRLMKQDSWLAGFGRPAHTLSASVCVWAPGFVLAHSTVLFLKPLPHFREHCQINRNVIMKTFYIFIVPSTSVVHPSFLEVADPPSFH